jgi:hypothetical protein
MDAERELEEAARASEDGEAFRAVLRTPRYRLGVVARPPGLYVEATLVLFPGHRVDDAHLERCLDCLRALRERGYELSYEGNGSVAAERAVADAEAELDVIKEIMRGLEGV